MKAIAILATGQQPALLFELAPLLMGCAILALAQQLPSGRPRTICAVAGATAIAAGVVVVVGETMPIPTVAFGVAIAGSNLMVLVGLVTAGLSLRRSQQARLPLALGLLTIPALLIGGLLAWPLGERALEVPVAGLGAAWIALGVQLGRGRYSCGT